MQLLGVMMGNMIVLFTSIIMHKTVATLRFIYAFSRAMDSIKLIKSY